MRKNITTTRFEPTIPTTFWATFCSFLKPYIKEVIFLCQHSLWYKIFEFFWRLMLTHIKFSNCIYNCLKLVKKCTNFFPSGFKVNVYRFQILEKSRKGLSHLRMNIFHLKTHEAIFIPASLDYYSHIISPLALCSAHLSVQ